MYRLKTPSRRVGEVLSVLADDLSVGAAARVFGHGEFTIRTWLTRAGLHATSLHERLFQNLKLLHLQLDELCTKTRQRADALWVWFAVDARTKIIAVLKVGPRTQPMAHAVVHALVKVLVPDCLPVFTSDGLKLYFYSLTAHFGSWAEVIGRQTHQWQVHAGLLYGQLTKHYRRRRLVRVERRALLGSFDQLTAALRSCGESGTIQTAFFDALFQFKPFQFVGDVGGRVVVRKGGSDITSVSLDMTLTGLAPWHARGKATFAILGIKYAVHFNKSFGPEAAPQAPEVIDVTPLLVNAACDVRNWSGQFARQDRPLVSMRPTAGDTQTVLAHPLSELTFRQRIVPLNLTITHYGNAALHGDQLFTIHNVTLNGDSITPAAVTDHFAPAQYFEMSDDEKLTRPAFEQMEAGLHLGSGLVRYGASVQAPIEYATITVDPQNLETVEETETYPMPAEHVPPLARQGAAGLAALRRTGMAKYRTIGPRVTVADTTYVIATTDQLRGEAILGLAVGESVTYTAAIEALRSFVTAHPERRGSLQVTRSRSG